MDRKKSNNNNNNNKTNYINKTMSENDAIKSNRASFSLKRNNCNAVDMYVNKLKILYRIFSLSLPLNILIAFNSEKKIKGRLFMVV